MRSTTFVAQTGLGQNSSIIVAESSESARSRVLGALVQLYDDIMPWICQLGCVPFVA